MAFKRIAREGSTTDGRKITRQWLNDIAETYNPDTYGARIWMEHMRGMFADGPFPALGDVRAVKVKENANGELELFADMDPTPRLKQMNKDRQKVFTSMEIDEDFAGKGKTYLVGVGVTDTPASLGSEMLSFAHQQGTASPLNARKHKPTNVFTQAIEVDGDWDKDDAEFSDSDTGKPKDSNDQTSLKDKFNAIFRRQDRKAAEGDAALRAEVEESLGLFAERHGALAEQVAGLPSKEDLEQIKAKVDQIYTALDNTPDQPPRTHATGSGDSVKTDC